MALLQLFAALAGQAAVTGLDDIALSPAGGLLEHAYVVRVSPRSHVLTSLIVFTTDFDVIGPSGRRYTLTMIDGGPYEYVPPLGSTCRIRFEPPAIHYGANYPGQNMVRELTCDTGVFPDPSPGRIAQARVVRVSPLPTRRRGRHPYVDFEVELPGRAVPPLYLPLRDVGPTAPVVGARCNIAFDFAVVQRRDIGLSGGGTAWLPIVKELRCGGPLELPAAVQRSPNAR